MSPYSGRHLDPRLEFARRYRMTELDELLQQSRQVAEHIRILAEEHQTLRIKHKLLNDRHKPTSNALDTLCEEQR